MTWPLKETIVSKGVILSINYKLCKLKAKKKKMDFMLKFVTRYEDKYEVGIFFLDFFVLIFIKKQN